MPVPVTIDNFARAESDLYFAGLLKDSGGIGNSRIAASRRGSTIRL